MYGIINVVLVYVHFYGLWGNVSVYRCCVQLFIKIHLVPIVIHKSIGMCIMVALHCCINILNCISKNLFTTLKFLHCIFDISSRHICFYIKCFCINFAVYYISHLKLWGPHFSFQIDQKWICNNEISTENVSATI